ncbi:MAG: hypothetical protein NC938_01325 [Candidatus Omnitrophica bacterium]|nr:hypothetical protein [Candidatus Omnitrophota bacterium]MCM8790330.1 hypothetical protein [Candidatus Omnitrophota bacterium]
MGRLTTKAITGLEQRMKTTEGDPVRQRILECAKNFKTSWIDLGQALYSVWKDKLYRQWGYITFGAYAVKEIGIRKTTALKLLKSYYFLEREEPALLERERTAEADVASLPSYESINVLRLARDNKAIDEADYRALKKEVFEAGKETKDVRKTLSAMIRQRDEMGPEEARRRRKEAVIRRLISTLKSLKAEVDAAKMLPAAVLKDLAGIVTRIESEIGR